MRDYPHYDNTEMFRLSVFVFLLGMSFLAAFQVNKVGLAEASPVGVTWEPEESVQEDLFSDYYPENP